MLSPLLGGIMSMISRKDSVSDVEINNLIDVVIVGNWLSRTMNFGFSGHRSGKSLPIEVLERFQKKINLIFSRRKPVSLSRILKIS